MVLCQQVLHRFEDRFGQSVFLENIMWDNTGWDPGAPVMMFENLALGYKDNLNGCDKGLNMGLVDATNHTAAVDFSAIPHTASTLTIDFIFDNGKGKNMVAIDDVLVLLNGGNAFVDLGTLGGTYSFARGINNCSTVVGFSTTSIGEGRAFIWDDVNGMRDMNDFLDPSVAGRLVQGWSINDAGDVAGEAALNGAKGFLLNN